MQVERLDGRWCWQRKEVTSAFIFASRETDELVRVLSSPLSAAVEAAAGEPFIMGS